MNEYTLPQALDWPESTSFKNTFSLLRVELNQAWILPFFLSTWVDEAWLFTAPNSRHFSYSATLHPSSMKGSIISLQSLFQSVSSNELGRLMVDYLLDYDLTCLLVSRKVPPLHYTRGLASRLSSVIIKSVSLQHMKRLPKWPAAKTFEWFEWKNREKGRSGETPRSCSMSHSVCNIQLHQEGSQMLECLPQREVAALLLRTSSFIRQQERGKE